jgi:hypothetical protein
LAADGPPRTLRVALEPVFGDQSIRRALTSRQFRIVRAAPEELVLRRRGLTLVLRRMEPHAAVRAFRRGDLDEAPVPQGEIRALEADPTLSLALRARELRLVDVVVFPPRIPRDVVRAYRLTAPRADYQQLIAERVARAIEPASAGDFRRARASIGRLPRHELALGLNPRVEELAEIAELVWAEWRQLGFPLGLQAEPADVQLRRVPPGPERANVVALGWVAEARLVSPRVRGWELLADGTVDYTRVTLEPGA